MQVANNRPSTGKKSAYSPISQLQFAVDVEEVIVNGA